MLCIKLSALGTLCPCVLENTCTVSELDEFMPSLKSLKNRFHLSAGLNFEKLNTILSETNHIGAQILEILPQVWIMQQLDVCTISSIT